MNSIHSERNSSEGLEEMVGEVKAENNGLISLIKRYTIGFGFGVIAGILSSGLSELRPQDDKSIYKILFGSAGGTAGIIGSAYFVNKFTLREEVFSVNIPCTFLGIFVGSTIGKYYLQ